VTISGCIDVGGNDDGSILGFACNCRMTV